MGKLRWSWRGGRFSKGRIVSPLILFHVDTQASVIPKRTFFSLFSKAFAVPALLPPPCRRTMHRILTPRGLSGRSLRRALRVQVVAWRRRRGLARASCRFATCFPGLPWSTRESISSFNCSTSLQHFCRSGYFINIIYFGLTVSDYFTDTNGDLFLLGGVGLSD